MLAVAAHIFFDDWMGVPRTAVVGALSYALLILLLRVSGKRTLSKMNAFDLVVTIARGSLEAELRDQRVAHEEIISPSAARVSTPK